MSKKAKTIIGTLLAIFFIVMFFANFSISYLALCGLAILTTTIAMFFPSWTDSFYVESIKVAVKQSALEAESNALLSDDENLSWGEKFSSENISKSNEKLKEAKRIKKESEKVGLSLLKNNWFKIMSGVSTILVFLLGVFTVNGPLFIILGVITYFIYKNAKGKREKKMPTSIPSIFFKHGIEGTWNSDDEKIKTHVMDLARRQSFEWKFMNFFRSSLYLGIYFYMALNFYTGAINFWTVLF